MNICIIIGLETQGEKGPWSEVFSWDLHLEMNKAVH